MYSQDGLGLIAHTQVQGDPTHTLTLRRAYSAQMTKRFRALKGVIRKSLIDNDALGLKSKPNNQSITNAPPGGKDAEQIKGQFNPIPARRFDFARSSDKIEGFMEWLDQQQKQGILEVTQQQQIGRAIENQWQNTYIRSAYQKGILRARQEMQNAGYTVPDIEDVGGINAVFNQKFHADRCGSIYTRAFNELKGITDAMDQQISRTLAEGIGRGDGPEVMARAINDRVDKVGLSRARTMARTETIRAHHSATIQEYRNAGVEGVKVKAEWSTAGDSRVCELCKPLEGHVFDLDTIEGMIPRHPNCFISSTVPIYTSEGWKSIGSIEIGDFVLTHKQRFKRVYALPRDQVIDPVTVTVYVPAIDDSIEITEEHPVLVVGSGSSFVWKEAKELTNSDWCIVDLVNEDIKACLVEVTKQAKTDTLDLYNLSVEEDESYIAKGVIVHNCRCCALPVDVTEAEEEAGEEVTEETVEDAVSLDPVAGRFVDRASAEEFLSKKREYREFFDQYSNDDLKLFRKLNDMPPDNRSMLVSDDELIRFNEIQSQIKDMLEQRSSFGHQVIHDWQDINTHDVNSMLLKRTATNVEEGLGDVVYPDSMDLNTVQAVQDGELPIQDYINLRAINQAYMDRVGIESETLYRGIDGRSGKKIAQVVRQGMDERDHFNIKNSPLSGFTSKQMVADRFGVDEDGITYVLEVSKDEIIVHSDLLGGITNANIDEVEFIVRGGVKTIDTSNIDVE